MLINLTVNTYASRVASVAELRQKLAPFAWQQFRKIWVSMLANPGRAHQHKLWLLNVSEA
jgi:hypothetical protein